MKTIKEQHQQWCVHYHRDPWMKTGEHCNAGIVYDDLARVSELGRTGSMLRLPCIRSHHDEANRRVEPLCPCDKLQWPTEMESEAHERMMKEHMAKMAKALAVIAPIRKEHKGKDWHGKIPCPVCGTGELMVRHSGYNGHVWARCTTPSCVAWIE